MEHIFSSVPLEILVSALISISDATNKIKLIQHLNILASKSLFTEHSSKFVTAFLPQRTGNSWKLLAVLNWRLQQLER